MHSALPTLQQRQSVNGKETGGDIHEVQSSSNGAQKRVSAIRLTSATMEQTTARQGDYLTKKRQQLESRLQQEDNQCSLLAIELQNAKDTIVDAFPSIPRMGSNGSTLENTKNRDLGIASTISLGPTFAWNQERLEIFKHIDNFMQFLGHQSKVLLGATILKVCNNLKKDLEAERMITQYM